MRLVVYKLGGSLLDCAEFPVRLTELVAGRPAHVPVFVGGGGRTADVVRAWDQCHQLGEERAHGLAIEALGFNDAFLQLLLPRMRPTTSRALALEIHAKGQWPLVDAHGVLSRDEPADTLPHHWDVTSDSIAAHVASRWQADELVLVKSTGLPESCTLRDAQQFGLVDAYFDRALRNVPEVSWVNLRSVPLRIRHWL